MNPDSENFDALRKLLALKRHEVPPPGYFDRFSRDVMARIKAGELGGTVGVDSSWFQRLAAVFDVKPVFAGAFGAAVCALLISGIISSEGTRSTGPTVAASSEGNPRVMSTQPAAATVAMEPSPFTPASSNAPVASMSIFDRFSPIQTQPVDLRYWVPPNNN